MGCRGEARLPRKCNTNKTEYRTEIILVGPVAYLTYRIKKCLGSHSRETGFRVMRNASSFGFGSWRESEKMYLRKVTAKPGRIKNKYEK